MDPYANELEASLQVFNQSVFYKFLLAITLRDYIYYIIYTAYLVLISFYSSNIFY